MQIRIEPPNEKQKQFLRAKNRFVGYGGSRGGGKSWAIDIKAILLAAKYGGIKILILRRTYPDVRENHILPMMQRLSGIARYKDTEKVFIFPNSSRIKFGYCDTEKDLLQYQGREYDVMFIDEATQFLESWFQKLTASIRGVNEFPKRIYLTCNPGGVGHHWVKRLFIDKEYLEHETPEDYLMIRAKVYDNTALLKKDENYVRFLRNLPNGLREAWLHGDWDLFQGQYFTEWKRDIHVMEPIPIPADWRRYVAMDYGLDMLACYWIAVDGCGRAYVYKELYESGLRVSDAAKKILDLTDEEIYATYAPPDLWNRHSDSGKSTAEIFSEMGITLVRAKNERVHGWYNLKEWLKPYRDERGEWNASLKVCSNCVNLIRTLPALQHDQKNPNDVANEPHELTHAPDALRYFVAGRPLPAGDALQENEDREFERGVEELLRFGG